MPLSRAEAIDALHHVMDCRALNLDQTRMIATGADDAHALINHIAGLLRAGVDPTEVATMTTLCRRLLELNVAEGEEEMVLAGLVEAVVQRELAADVVDRVTVKSVAAKLRGPLREMTDQIAGKHRDGIAFFKASCAVREVLASASPEWLLTHSVRHELGAGPYATLEMLVGATETV